MSQLDVSSPISVALADGNPLVLSAMSEVIERDERFSLVSTSSSAEGFLGMVMRVPVDIGIIDWGLPILGAQKLIEVLRDQEESLRIVIYGDGQAGDVPRLAMAAGAAGFCARDKPAEVLLDTVAAVARGQMMFPFLDIRELQADPVFQLTKREKALLIALSRGLTNKALAAEFDISVNTVKFHLGNLFEKLGVRNRAQAIAYFYSSTLASEAKGTSTE